MYTIHGTRKLLDRVKQPIGPAVAEPSTALGNWYGTAIFWKPRQVALLVNERTLLPVLMPLAPASSLVRWFPEHLAVVLEALEVPPDFVMPEIAVMAECSFAKTSNRSVVGSMNEFAFMAGVSRAQGATEDLPAMSVRLVGMPCGPLRKRHRFPDLEVAALVSAWSGE